MEEKLKVKPTLTAVIIIIISIIAFVISLVTGVLMYFEGDKNFVYEYDYTTINEVRNSTAYQYALDVLREIKTNDGIDELKEIKWMCHETEERVSYTTKAYFKVSYVSNGVSKTVWYLKQDVTIKQQYWQIYDAVDFVKAITEEVYKNEMDSWLIVDDYEKSTLAREKSYNAFALSVFANDVGV